MAGNEDDDNFSDDDFPDIPDDELRRLEQYAISLTQHESVYGEQQHDPETRRVSSLLRTERRNLPLTDARSASVSDQTFRAEKSQSFANTVRRDSSNGSIFDEDGLPLVVEEPKQQDRDSIYQDESTRREQWRINRFAGLQTQAPARQARVSSHSRPNPRNNARLDPHPNFQGNASQSAAAESHTAVNVAVRNAEEELLRARVTELLKERDDLMSSLQKAKDEVVARRGEVANIRQKHFSEEKTYQNQIAVLQKLNQEESEKHAASIQSKNTENGQIASEIKFLKQELKEESRKVQAYQRQLKDRSLADKSNNINTTPKRSHALRDGFDDDEMAIVSPVKSGRRSKPGTPTANRKRKQPTGADHNVQPLALRLSGTKDRNESQGHVAIVGAEVPQTITIKDPVAEQHLQLLQRVTSFRSVGSEEPFVEQLLKLFFPSDARKSLGWMVFDATAKLEGQRFPGDLVQVFINLWARAKQEKYYSCIGLLIEVISSIIDHDPFAIDEALLSSILPVLQSTVEINAVTRFQLLRKDHLNIPSKPKPIIEDSINNTECLRLMHTIACLVSDDHELISVFWRGISTDFVLMMLNACQKIPDITLMLQMLATSILPDTFGMICETTQQSKFENYICDRICYLLWEPPRSDMNDPPYSFEQICLLRQESLDLLAKWTLGSSPNPFNPSTAHNHGTVFVANHASAVSRLVRCAYDELAAAYQMTPDQHLHIQIVNTAVRILHFVLSSPAGRQIVWQSKIAGINGGSHKFRVVMARLAYAESRELGIDTGITGDTVRMATELLEESVTPDEVEDLFKLFEEDGISGSRRAHTLGSTQR